MTLRSLVRTLIVKWYVMIPGLLLSLAMAGVTFSVVAPTYSSSGVAVLVQPKQQGGNSTNPLLNFDPSLNTTASIMIQSLNSPVIAPRVSVSAGSSFSVKNVGTVTTGDPSQQPFMYINTQSQVRDDSAAMVYRLMDLARQQLVERQQALRVRPATYIKLDVVVDPTPPKYVIGTQVAASGAALLIGMIVTIALVLLGDRFDVNRRRASDAFPVEDELLAPWPPVSGSTLAEPDLAVTANSLAAHPTFSPHTNSNSRSEGQHARG